MLVLAFYPGQQVYLFDEESNAELGVVKFLTPRYSNSDQIHLGFDLPARIKIVREELLCRKDNKIRKDCNAEKETDG